MSVHASSRSVPASLDAEDRNAAPPIGRVDPGGPAEPNGPGGRGGRAGFHPEDADGLKDLLMEGTPSEIPAADPLTPALPPGSPDR